MDLSLLTLVLAGAAQAQFSLRCLEGTVTMDEAGAAEGIATLRVDNPSGRIAYWLKPVMTVEELQKLPAVRWESCAVPAGEFVEFRLPMTRVPNATDAPEWAWQGSFALPRHPEHSSDVQWEFVSADAHWSAASGLTMAVAPHAPDLVRLGASKSWLSGLAVEVDFFEHVGHPEMRFTYRNATSEDLYWTPNPEGCSKFNHDGEDRWRDGRELADGSAHGYGGVGCSPLHVDEPPTAEQLAEWRMAPGAVRTDCHFSDCSRWTEADGLPYADPVSRMIEWGRSFQVARPSGEPPVTRGGWKKTYAHARWSLEQGGSLAYRRF